MLFLNRPRNIMFVISVMVAFNIGHNVIHLSKPGLSLRRKAIARSGRKMRHSRSTPAIWDGNNLIRLSYTYTTLGYVKKLKPYH